MKYADINSTDDVDCTAFNLPPECEDEKHEWGEPSKITFNDDTVATTNIRFCERCSAVMLGDAAPTTAEESEGEK